MPVPRVEQRIFREESQHRLSADYLPQIKNEDFNRDEYKYRKSKWTRMTDWQPSRLCRVEILVILLTAAVLLRMLYLQYTQVIVPIRADAKQYVFYGYHLLKHGVFSAALPQNSHPPPDSYRSPGYPVLVAISIYFGGEKGFYSLLLSMQAVLGGLSVWLTYLLGRRFLSWWGAFGAAVLVAVSPHLVAMTGYILTETLFSCVFLASLLLFALAWRTNCRGYYLAAAIMFGGGYLVNETSLFLPGLFASLVWWKTSSTSPKEKNNRVGVLLFLGVFLLFPLAWTARNMLTLPPGAATSADRALATLTHGAYPDFVYKRPSFRYFPYRDDPQNAEMRRSLKDFLRIVGGRAAEHPLRYFTWYVFEKPYYLWSWNILQGQGDVYVYPVTKSLYTASASANWSRLAMKYLHPFLLLIALAGGIICLRRWWQTRDIWGMDLPIFFLVGIPLVYYTALYTVFAPWPRYTVPLRPELYLWVMWVVRQMVQGNKVQREEEFSTTGKGALGEKVTTLHPNTTTLDFIAAERQILTEA